MPSPFACAGLRMATAWPPSLDLAAVGRRDAEDDLCQFAAAGTDQAGKADNLTRPQRQADAVGRRLAHDVPQLEDRFADRYLELGEQRVDLAPDHHLDEVVAVGVAYALGRDILAVAEHRHAVGEQEYLLQPVADIDDADAAGAQQPHDGEQPLDVALREGRRRLVHDEDAGLLRQRAWRSRRAGGCRPRRRRPG
jgi:hypothetical protein